MLQRKPDELFIPDDKKKKKKKKKTLDYSKLQESGYKPPEDAATDIRAAREEAEKIKIMAKANLLEAPTGAVTGSCVLIRVCAGVAGRRASEGGGKSQRGDRVADGVLYPNPTHAIHVPSDRGVLPSQKKRKAEEDPALPAGINQRNASHGSSNPIYRKGNGMPEKKGRGKKGETVEQTWNRERTKIALGMAEARG